MTKILLLLENVLYVHFKYRESAPSGTRLIEIPPAIFDRLLFLTNICTAVYAYKGQGTGSIRLNVIDYNNKHYFSNIDNMDKGDTRRIFGIFMLKDI